MCGRTCGFGGGSRATSSTGGAAWFLSSWLRTHVTRAYVLDIGVRQASIRRYRRELRGAPTLSRCSEVAHVVAGGGGFLRRWGRLWLRRGSERGFGECSPFSSSTGEDSRRCSTLASTWHQARASRWLQAVSTLAQARTKGLNTRGSMLIHAKNWKRKPKIGTEGRTHGVTLVSKSIRILTRMRCGSKSV